ncbi:MAG: hypothetical protein A2X33_02620 [Elusimicrobia bacterium GWA2_51_34]|nr:MAG: hypothetical protein A2X33_02620 [Elusimicrobia bacterium GWA2_51_34]
MLRWKWGYFHHHLALDNSDAFHVLDLFNTMYKFRQYCKEKLAIPFSYQVVGKKSVDRFSGGIRVISADRFFSALI